MISLILLVLAFVCAMLATFGVPGRPNFNLLAASLMFYFLSLLVGHAGIR